MASHRPVRNGINRLMIPMPCRTVASRLSDMVSALMFDFTSDRIRSISPTSTVAAELSNGFVRPLERLLYGFFAPSNEKRANFRLTREACPEWQSVVNTDAMSEYPDRFRSFAFPCAFRSN
ncbi:hypothetical protein Pst134EB_012633 [Puccinia striiformis f. sp. tritici]|nr:hypothetical protein Pst134EB_012633 [Puccinia striiformis f. sp. tritici]